MSLGLAVRTEFGLATGALLGELRLSLHQSLAEQFPDKLTHSWTLVDAECHRHSKCSIECNEGKIAIDTQLTAQSLTKI